MSNQLDINFLENKLLKLRNDRDWEQFHNLKDLSIGLSIEASEFMELFLWKNPDEINELLKDESYLQKVKDEYADIFIFCILIKSKLNLDINDIVLEKIAKIADKYPINLSKGCSKKYDELS